MNFAYGYYCEATCVRTRTAASGRICSLFLLFPEEILRQRAAVAECERRGAAHAQAAAPGCALGVVSNDVVYIDSIAEMPCDSTVYGPRDGRQAECTSFTVPSRNLSFLSFFLPLSPLSLHRKAPSVRLHWHRRASERASTCVELASALLARDWNAHERTARKKRTPETDARGRRVTRPRGRAGLWPRARACGREPTNGETCYARRPLLCLPRARAVLAVRREEDLASISLLTHSRCHLKRG